MDSSRAPHRLAGLDLDEEDEGAPVPRPVRETGPPKPREPDVRVIVGGSRDWKCDARAERVVRRLVARYGKALVVVHDCAPGAATAIDAACLRLGVRRDPVFGPGDDAWPRPGPERHDRMVALGAAFAIVCHPYLANSLGTRGLVARALAAGIPVYLLDADDAEPRRVLAV
jgi:hypothetical protein